MTKLAATPPDNRAVRAYHWGTDEIRAFSTDQIVQKLRDFGVGFTKERFLKEAHDFYSACDLADHWRNIYPIKAKGFDVDFIWMAAIVLWERLAPDVINSEKLDDMMQDAYKMKDEVATCTLWLEVWEHLKKRFTADMKSIDDAEEVFSGLQCLSNWCQDLEMELGNAARDDSSFYEKRIGYCQEFCRLFPESDSLILHNMKRAIAESYFGLGMIEEGDRSFESLIREFSDSAWGYIGWGDMHYTFRLNDAVPLNYEKARQIYQMAMGKDIEDEEHVVERLTELEKEYQKNKGEPLR